MPQELIRVFNTITKYIDLMQYMYLNLIILGLKYIQNFSKIFKTLEDASTHAFDLCTH